MESRRERAGETVDGGGERPAMRGSEASAKEMRAGRSEAEATCSEEHEGAGVGVEEWGRRRGRCRGRGCPRASTRPSPVMTTSSVCGTPRELEKRRSEKADRGSVATIVATASTRRRGDHPTTRGPKSRGASTTARGSARVAEMWMAPETNHSARGRWSPSARSFVTASAKAARSSIVHAQEGGGGGGRG